MPLEATPDPVVDPVTATAAEPVKEPATIVEPAAEPVKEPAVEPAKESAADPAADPKVVEPPPKADVSPPKIEPKAADPKPDPGTQEPAKAVGEGAPEKYELSLSNRSPLEKSHLTEFEKYGKENRLSQTQLQTLINARETELNTEIDARSNDWLDQAKADPDIGGDNYQETLNLANDGVDLLDTDGKLRAELDRYGYGNHPEIMRAFAKVGRQNRSAPIRMGGAGSSKTSKTAQHVLYGGTKAK